MRTIRRMTMVALGAGASYLFDPECGKRRRADLRAKLRAHETSSPDRRTNGDLPDRAFDTIPTHLHEEYRADPMMGMNPSGSDAT